MWKEFKEFALKGQVISLAVGVIIGAGMGKIVDSIVKDLVMPVISATLGGKIDFSNMFVVLGEAPSGVAPTYDALTKAGVPVFAYGNFITTLINFLLLMYVLNVGVFMNSEGQKSWHNHDFLFVPREPTIYTKKSGAVLLTISSAQISQATSVT